MIVPACNEEAYIGPCLDALAAQTLEPGAIGGARLILAANACRDRTVATADTHAAALRAKGWQVDLLDLPEGGKLRALNAAEARIAAGDPAVRLFLDADIRCSPDLVRQIMQALAGESPRYASGRLTVARAQSWVSRCYGRVWQNLPFMKTNVPGAGVFAVNAAGRRRWEAFPDIIADDLFVRLCFAPGERIRVEADYLWPLVEGFAALVKVRRRQDAGTAELALRYPDLMANESKPPVRPGDHLRLFLGQPVSYAVYVTIMLTVKLGGRRGRASEWVRGR